MELCNEINRLTQEIRRLRNEVNYINYHEIEFSHSVAYLAGICSTIANYQRQIEMLYINLLQQIREGDVDALDYVVRTLATTN